MLTPPKPAAKDQFITLSNSTSLLCTVLDPVPFHMDIDLQGVTSLGTEKGTTL